MLFILHNLTCMNCMSQDHLHAKNDDDITVLDGALDKTKYLMIAGPRSTVSRAPDS